VAVSAPTAIEEEEVMIRSRWTPVFVFAALILLPALAAAQEGPEMLTWVGMFEIKPGADMQYEKAFEKYDRPLFDQLIADGKAVSWGLGYELAGPGGYDYVIWITVPGWAGIGAVEAMFDERWEGMEEEELAAMLESFVAVVEPGTQRTQLLRHKVFEANPEAEYKYLRLSAFTVKPGHGDDFLKMYKSFAAPVQAQLFESGVIAGYGFLNQAVHSDGSFSHETWITFSDLADLDAYDKAFDEAYEEISDGDGVARRTAWMKMMEPDAHFDRLIRVWKKSK
jgi:hypothetical protein